MTPTVEVQPLPTVPQDVLQIFVLLLMAGCCYGLQVLFEKQRRAEEEAREFSARQEQLHSAGRLAAQIAHQIKNPLGIINNAAYSLQRALEQGKDTGREQIEIIREEVERSDQIITKLMGYAQLAEGRVEKLRIDEELDRAIEDVFPSAAAYEATIETDYAEQLPALFPQSEIQIAGEIAPGLERFIAEPGDQQFFLAGNGVGLDRMGHQVGEIAAAEIPELPPSPEFHRIERLVGRRSQPRLPVEIGRRHLTSGEIIDSSHAVIHEPEGFHEPHDAHVHHRARRQIFHQG